MCPTNNVNKPPLCPKITIYNNIHWYFFFLFFGYVSLTFRTSYGKTKPAIEKTQINCFHCHSQKITWNLQIIFFPLVKSYSYKTVVPKCQDYILIFPRDLHNILIVHQNPNIFYCTLELEPCKLLCLLALL